MKFHIAIIFSMLSFSFFLHGQGLTVGEAINMAGGMRMLTQRMTKCYLMLGQDIRVNRARDEMDEAVSMFEEQMLELQDYTPNPKVTKALKEVYNLWVSFRVKVVSQPNRLTASIIMEQANELMEECNDVVILLEKLAKLKAARTVNLSARQRMLTQRIASLYLAYNWKLPNNKETYVELKKAQEEYEVALKELASSKINTSKITQQLNEVISQWEFSKQTFSVRQTKMMPSVITVTTSSMMEKFDNITNLYAKIVSNQILVSR